MLTVGFSGSISVFRFGRQIQIFSKFSSTQVSISGYGSKSEKRATTISRQFLREQDAKKPKSLSCLADSESCSQIVALLKKKLPKTGSNIMVAGGPHGEHSQYDIFLNV